MTFENISILGKGRRLPKEEMPNKKMPFVDDKADKWIRDNLGIESRYFSPYEDVVSLGFSAGRRALTDAGIDVDDIDMIIVSCSSPTHYAPSIACQIQSKLGAVCPAVDINAVCSGFIYALDMGCRYVQDDKKVLIIATEGYSRITDFTNRDCVYFGDGAGAVILGRGKSTIHTNIFAGPYSGEAFVAPAVGKYSMKGRMVYDQAVDMLPAMVLYALTETDIDTDDVDLMIPHQAGIRVIQALSDALNIPMEKVVTVMDKYANMASASIPVAMAETDTDVKNLLLVAIGSGWTYGVAIIQS